ncbi:hydroxyethylthiazole kinase, partial [Erysipelatoclostridium ramosum]
MSEIKVLSGGMGGARGVDACETDIVTEETLEEAVAFVKAFAKSCGCIVAVTGAIDLVADDKRCYVIRNG